MGNLYFGECTKNAHTPFKASDINKHWATRGHLLILHHKLTANIHEKSKDMANFDSVSWSNVLVAGAKAALNKVSYSFINVMVEDCRGVRLGDT